MSRIEVDYLGEGRTDTIVARKLIAIAGATPGRSYLNPVRGTGKHNLDQRLPGLNAGARWRPVLVLRDLDQDAPCASALVSRLVPHRDAGLLLRICVRSVEAWFIADRAAYARYCGAAVASLPAEPERVTDLKASVMALAAAGKASRLLRHIEDRRRVLAPEWTIMPEWNAEFARQVWDPARAAATGLAPSLNRAIDRLTQAVGRLGPTEQ